MRGEINMCRDLLEQRAGKRGHGPMVGALATCVVLLGVVPIAADDVPVDSNVSVSIVELGGGLYDVLATTEVPVAGFALGIEITGGCETLQVISITPGPDLPMDGTGFFETNPVGRGMTVGVVLSLEPPGPMLVGEDLLIATVQVCGNQNGEEGCELNFSNSLGDPPVKTTFSTALGETISTVTEGTPLVSVVRCFRRGEANDDASFDVADPINILGFLFLGGSTLCLDALDSNDDGAVDIADSAFLLNFLFINGPEPAAPGYEDCGPDSTDDALDCESYATCL